LGLKKQLNYILSRAAVEVREREFWGGLNILKIGIAQINPKVGHIEGNVQKIKQFYHKLISQKSDLVVFPELCVVGYPPKDLLERWWFIDQIRKAKEELVALTSSSSHPGIVFGLPLPTGEKQGKGLVNAALLAYRGKIIHQQNKSLLPTYDVFDETRYFDPAQQQELVSFKGELLGISVCEDAWNDPEFWPKGRRYQLDPIQVMAGKGATCLLNISASPFQIDKEKVRFRLIHNHSQRFHLPFVYVNQVGGNDDLIFDGKSLVCNNQGDLIKKAPGFREWAGIVDLEDQSTLIGDHFQDSIETIFDALVLGVQDYMKKCGFKKAVIGLSGGIDSSLTAVIAARAVGPRNVLGVSMPSPYSSAGSIEYSQRLSENLGITFEVIPISSIYFSYIKTLFKNFAETKMDTTEENLQARIRGNILMAFSNKYGYLLLSTGNKSEMATGYCTLYGDMSGGLAVLSDVPKTMVYQIAEYVNHKSEIIPQEIIQKAPSAELKPNQYDQDTLPPYPVLDQIIELWIEDGLSIEEIAARGFDRKTVLWTVKRIDQNEYKRKQAPPGLKVTSKAFGSGRRMPIAADYSY